MNTNLQTKIYTGGETRLQFDLFWNRQLTSLSLPLSQQEDSDQGDDDERRKSVAFKIMVDTKEIQAENEGPAQKKAAAKSDAMDILAANAKKMAEEGADDDSDEEVLDEKF